MFRIARPRTRSFGTSRLKTPYRLGTWATAEAEGKLFNKSTEFCAAAGSDLRVLEDLRVRNVSGVKQTPMDSLQNGRSASEGVGCGLSSELRFLQLLLRWLRLSSGCNHVRQHALHCMTFRIRCSVGDCLRSFLKTTIPSAA